ncbi:MAG: hypothetical protein HYV36_00670 [Lentisphaerae bacterium]|nr:hypothetical protein [Lentisphaerota bacterium]
MKSCSDRASHVGAYPYDPGHIMIGATTDIVSHMRSRDGLILDGVL